MANENWFGIEAEEMGMVALIAVILLPGFIWVAKGKSTQSKIVRSAVVGSLVFAAASVEAAADQTANEIGDVLGGENA